MISQRPALPRRRRALALLATGALAACGGDGGVPIPPAPPGSDSDILHFGTDKSHYSLGEQPRVSLQLKDPSAQGELSILDDARGPWPIKSGETVQLAGLRGRGWLKLTVTKGQVILVAQLRLDVPVRGVFRDSGLRLGAISHAMAALDDGSVLVVGGTRHTNALSDAVERFDPHTGRVDRMASLASGRSGHRLVPLGAQRYLVLGGVSALPSGPHAEVIDARDGQVLPVGNAMALHREQFVALKLADGRVLVTSGKAVVLYLPSSNLFQKLNVELLASRGGHSMAQLTDGRVLIVGGYGANPIAEAFNPADNSIVRVDSSADALALGQQSQQSMPFDLPVWAGGEDLQGRISDAIHRYDAPTRSVVRASLRLPRPLFASASARLSDGSMGLFGGQHSTELLGSRATLALARDTNTLEMSIRTLPDLPRARVLHQAITLRTGHVLIAGGVNDRPELERDVLLFE